MADLDENTKDFIQFYSIFFAAIIVVLGIAYFAGKPQEKRAEGIKLKDITAIGKLFLYVLASAAFLTVAGLIIRFITGKI